MPGPPNLYALRRSILLPNPAQNFLDQSNPATVESAGMSEVASEKEVEALERRSKMKKARPESSTWTEVRGVYSLRSGRYGASIWDQSRRTQVWLGSFGTVEDAAGAYAAAAAKLPGGRKRPNCRPKFRGVYRIPSGKYGARIVHSKAKGRTWLGTFGTAEEAARAYDAAAVELHGARAVTNFCPGRRVRVDPSTRHHDLSVAEWLQVEELLKDTDSVDDKEALIDAAAILHQIALAGHEDGGRD